VEIREDSWLNSHQRTNNQPVLGVGRVNMTQPKKDVIDVLRDVAPDFQPRWQAFLEWWEGEEHGNYNAMAEFAHFLVDSYAIGNLDCFQAVFGEVERLLLEGDSETQSLLSVGLIEDIQNIASHHSFGASIFEPWLGKESLRVWREIDEGMRQVAVWASENPTPSSLRAKEAIEKVQDPELRKIVESTYHRDAKTENQ
jgi:hypothetical protein